uniref:Molybdate ABC transporter substrate binding protein n=1 Tax=Papaver somniferum TaxID=3469 RepID=A0A5B7LJQ6_PAPSO|nr:molybdate ABC transporter substrate binding protein [Papaver somniferum]
MDFGHLAFYNRELTLEDILREPQRVPERILYKGSLGQGET